MLSGWDGGAPWGRQTETERRRDPGADLGPRRRQAGAWPGARLLTTVGSCGRVRILSADCERNAAGGEELDGSGLSPTDSGNYIHY